MPVRIPLGMNQPDGQIQPQVYQMDTASVDNVHGFATYAYGQNPSARLEVNTANGSLMGGQPFVDTYYVAGAYSTRVDRYATEAETANIVLTTDNYNRLRLVHDAASLPTGDTNNLQYPLVLWNEVYGYDVTNASADDSLTHFRAMNRQDFIDTFVTPALSRMESDGFWNASQNKEQNGTYFITTSTNPANATRVSTTAVAVNSEANPSAYTASGIPEAVKQTTDINYYIAKVDYPATAYDVYDSEQSTYDLPLYFDAGTEQIYSHTPTSWANLLGPYLRYYFRTPGSGYYTSYALTGTTQKGSTYVDTRLTNSSTYQQRFVNANDYRTQEFPNGTQTTISANTQRLYITRTVAITETVSLHGTSGNPQTQDRFTLSDGSVSVGWRFASNGNIEEYDTDASPALDDNGLDWINTTPSTTYYIRATIQTSPSGGSSSGTYGSWLSLASNRDFRWLDNRANNAYADETFTIKIDIADDAAGSNILDTGYYTYAYSGLA